MPRLVAVTGGTGFIGGHVVAALAAAGWRVRILSRRIPAGPLFAGLTLDVAIGDLGDPASLEELVIGADAVVHCAGLVKARRRADFRRVNAEGTAALAAATVRQAPSAHFLHMSSLAAREPGISPYAASKSAAEEALTAQGGRLRWTALRPPVVYGPGDRETLLFFRCIGNGWVLLPAPKRARLSFLHVADLAAAVVTVLERLNPGGAIIEIDDGRRGGYGWSELVALGAQSVGRSPISVPVAMPVQVLASGLAVALARLAGRTPTLTPGKLREVRHPDWVCREDRLLAELGWWARIGVAEGFRETVAWYRAAGWL